MRDSFEEVVEMCIAFGQQVQEQPALPNEKEVRSLRIKLLLEEVQEYLTAEGADDLIGVADALGDIAVIIFGTAAAYGIPLPEVFDEIHRSNMAKVSEHGSVIRREDGKILKPEGWTPPNIEKVLFGEKP